MKSIRPVFASILIGLVIVGCIHKNFGELVCAGDIKAVRSALVRGQDPNGLVKGHLPLNISVYEYCSAQIDMTQLLLESGADVNLKDSFGTPPIVAAKGRWNTVKLFIEKGADVNATDSRGHTALMGYPIGGEEIEQLKSVYEMFAAAGADLEKVAPDGSSTKSWLKQHRPELVAYVDELIAKKKQQQ